MARPLVSVDLEALRLSPGPYCMSFEFDLGPLVRSIRQSGIINPPCIAQDTQEGWDVVAGYRRVLAARSLGQRTVLCLDLTRRVPSRLSRLLFNLQDNLATRAFNDMERAMVLSRLSQDLPRDTILESYMPLLGIPPHGPLLETYLGLEGLEPDIQSALAGGALALRTAEALLAMDPPARTATFEGLQNMRFNTNQQKLFIEFVHDISSAGSLTIPEVLAEPGLADLLGARDRNRPQRAQKVLERLRKRRFPRIAAAEERFQKAVARLSLPQGVRIHAPAHFEGPSYRLELLFRDGAELKERIQALGRTEGLESLGDPWPKRS